jgi:hypothetical protein
MFNTAEWFKNNKHILLITFKNIYSVYLFRTALCDLISVIHKNAQFNSDNGLGYLGR